MNFLIPTALIQNNLVIEGNKVNQLDNSGYLPQAVKSSDLKIDVKIGQERTSSLFGGTTYHKLMSTNAPLMLPPHSSTGHNLDYNFFNNHGNTNNRFLYNINNNNMNNVFAQSGTNNNNNSSYTSSSDGGFIGSINPRRNATTQPEPVFHSIATADKTKEQLRIEEYFK